MLNMAGVKFGYIRLHICFNIRMRTYERPKRSVIRRKIYIRIYNSTLSLCLFVNTVNVYIIMCLLKMPRFFLLLIHSSTEQGMESISGFMCNV